MVTLREAQRQRETKERQERLESIRHQAAELGKQNAKRYLSSKEEQNRQVREDLRRLWEKEQQAKRGHDEGRLIAAQASAGAAMQVAATYCADRASRAKTETEAWEAEMRLQKMRYKVSMDTLRLDREKAETQRAMSAARRENARQIEETRRKRLLEKRRVAKEATAVSAGGVNAESSAFLADFSATPRRLVPQPSPRVVVQNAQQRVEEQAAAHREQLEHKRQTDEEKESRRLRALQKRAGEIIAEKHRSDEVMELEKVRQEDLKRQLQEAARSSRHPINARDFQAEESRRSEAASRRAHKEFESVFLEPKSWPLAELRELDEAVERARRDDAALLGLAATKEDEAPIDVDVVF